MLPWPGKMLALGCLAALLTLSGGCVARKVVYGFLDTLLLRSIDGYFDVDSRQKAFLKAKLEEVHAWHATEELPKYVEDLRGLEARAADGGLGKEDVDWVYARFEAARQRVVARLLEDALAFLATVRPEQVDEMDEANADRNAKREKVLAKDDADYVEHRAEGLEKNAKAWMGSLSAAQRALIARHAEGRRAEEGRRLEATKASQARLSGLLRKGIRGDADKDALRAALLAGLSPLSPEKNPHQAALRDLFVALAASATPEQKAHFLKEVRAWRSDFEELSRTHRQASLSRSSGAVLSSNVSPH